MEFWEIHLLTKFVLESIKMNLHTSYAPFWNGISVSNLLIWSYLGFLGFYWHICGKHLCSVLWIRLCIVKIRSIWNKHSFNHNSWSKPWFNENHTNSFVPLKPLIWPLVGTDFDFHDLKNVQGYFPILNNKIVKMYIY